MTPLAQEQTLHLERVIAWAVETRNHLSGVLVERAGEVNFRPSSGGVAMVGLLPERPQRGKGGYTNLERLASSFEAQFEKHCRDVEQGRPTPEKQLQSFLTADALRHCRRMHAITAPQGAPNSALEFVTDELALPVVDGKQVVCDMLALRRQDDGTLRPVATAGRPPRTTARGNRGARGRPSTDCRRLLVPGGPARFLRCATLSSRS